MLQTPRSAELSNAPALTHPRKPGKPMHADRCARAEQLCVSAYSTRLISGARPARAQLCGAARLLVAARRANNG